VGVAGFFAVARAIVAGSFGWLTCRRIGLPFATFCRGVARVAGLVLPMAVVIYLFRLWLVAAGVPQAPRLVLLVVVGAAFYLALVRWRAPDLLSEVTQMILPRIRAVRPRRRRAKPDLVESLERRLVPLKPTAAREGYLNPALRTLARRSPLTVELDAPPLGSLPDEVEVLSYYLVAETLRNAADHARASVVRVRVERGAGLLRLTIRDDGIGGARPSRGSGIRRLRQSVERTGGTFLLESARGAGTVVSVGLPLASAEPAALAGSAGLD
jgi:hypothetical protein